MTTKPTTPEVGGERDLILDMCRAHDREEAAQIGEPTPWTEESEADTDWVDRRFYAMREAYDVVADRLVSPPAVPEEGLKPGDPITEENVRLLRAGDRLTVRSYQDEMKVCTLLEDPSADAGALRVDEPGMTAPNVWALHRFTFLSRPTPSPAIPDRGRLTDGERNRIEAARYMVGNPSAWDDYDEGASETIRDLCDILAKLEGKS